MEDELVHIVGVPATSAAVFLLAIDKFINLVGRSAKSTAKIAEKRDSTQFHTQTLNNKNVKEYATVIALSAIPAALGLCFSIKSAKRR